MNQIRLILLITCLVILQTIKSQEFSHEFGKVSKEELMLKHYDKDTSAEAVIIYNIGRSYFIPNSSYNFELYFEKTMKVKIFTKAGIKWAENQILYYGDERGGEEIINLKGNTYNLENNEIKTTALNPKTTYDEKCGSNTRIKKFAIPDIKEGSVFEVTYRIKSPYFIHFRTWEFQQNIPVIYSEYTTKMIPFYEYIALLQGADKYDDFKSYEDNTIHTSFTTYTDKVYVFVMKDLPAFKDESYITSKDDYIIKLDFQLAKIIHSNGQEEEFLSTWPKLIDKMIDNEYFGLYMNESKEKCKKIIETMKISSCTPIEKMKAIDHYIKLNYSWNGEKSKFCNQNVNEFLLKKTGNCTEINLFLAGMLNAAGINANPVLLSTRDNGKINLKYPLLQFFNYVVILARIDSTSYLLDATEPFCNFNELPKRCFNDMALIIQKKNDPEWVQFKSNVVSKQEYDFYLKTSDNKDSIYKNCRFITTGYDAIENRRRFSSSYDQLRENLLSQHSTSTDSLHAEHLNQVNQPFEITFQENIPLESMEDKMIIAPFCHQAWAENPLKMPDRNYPVDIVYRQAEIFQSTIAIPQGYQIFSKPEELELNNNLVKIVYKTVVKNTGFIKVIAFYELKKDIYEVADYKELRDYFSKIAVKFNENIILVKI